MLDNLVGGGLPHGMTPTSNTLKECYEEAGIPSEVLVQTDRFGKPAASLFELRSVSVIAFYREDSERGWMPDTEYVYDLEVPEGWRPCCTDGEVDSFMLLSIDEVRCHVSHFFFFQQKKSFDIAI
jgi:ADP-ribose pyrophosphatase YjhB (NUDIX family)